MKYFVTFSAGHEHLINGVVYNANTVAVLPCQNEEHGRTLANNYFGDDYAFGYSENEYQLYIAPHNVDPKTMHVIDVNDYNRYTYGCRA